MRVELDELDKRSPDEEEHRRNILHHVFAVQSLDEIDDRLWYAVESLAFFVELSSMVPVLQEADRGRVLPNKMDHLHP